MSASTKGETGHKKMWGPEGPDARRKRSVMGEQKLLGRRRFPGSERVIGGGGRHKKEAGHLKEGICRDTGTATDTVY